MYSYTLVPHVSRAPNEHGAERLRESIRTDSDELNELIATGRHKRNNQRLLRCGKITQGCPNRFKKQNPSFIPLHEFDTLAFVKVEGVQIPPTIGSNIVFTVI